MASEDSGARVSMTVRRQRDSQATLRVRVSHVTPFRVPLVKSSSKQKQIVMASVGALALVLGVSVGVTHLRSTRDPLLGSAHAKASPAPAVTALSVDSKVERALAAPTSLKLTVTPEFAETHLDGALLGHGNVQVPDSHDTTLHELRISAPGHITRIVLFRGTPNVQRVDLPRGK